jgi:hypothetical protein
MTSTPRTEAGKRLWLDLRMEGWTGPIDPQYPDALALILAIEAEASALDRETLRAALGVLAIRYHAHGGHLSPFERCATTGCADARAALSKLQEDS